MNKLLLLVCFIVFDNVISVELAVIKSFSSGIAVVFPEKRMIKIIAFAGKEQKDIQLLNIEQNILTAKQMEYGGLRIYYDKISFFDLGKNKILEFDPYKFKFTGYTVVDAYYVNAASWAVLLWKMPDFEEHWILFDIEKQEVLDNNYPGKKDFIIYKKDENLKKWESSWFLRKIIADRFHDLENSIKNGRIDYSRYKNYFLVSDFQKVLLYNAGPYISIKDEKFLYDLSGLFYIINYTRRKGESL